jgi:3'-5' exoribonuclease 1
MPDQLSTEHLLRALGLPGFEGRQHCGLDDARNSARVLREIARRGYKLHDNRKLKTSAEKRWDWMAGNGKVIWTAAADDPRAT